MICWVPLLLLTSLLLLASLASCWLGSHKVPLAPAVGVGSAVADVFVAVGVPGGSQLLSRSLILRLTSLEPICLCRRPSYSFDIPSATGVSSVSGVNAVVGVPTRGPRDVVKEPRHRPVSRKSYLFHEG